MTRHLAAVPTPPNRPPVVIVKWCAPGHCVVCAGRPLRLTRVITGPAKGLVACPLCSPEPGRDPIPAVLGIPFRTDLPRGGDAA